MAVIFRTHSICFTMDQGEPEVKNFLGKSELLISPIGIGGNLFGSYVEAKEAYTILHHAESLDINFIDTADVYGNGMSEDIIGRFLKYESSRSNWVVATKLGTRKGQSCELSATPRLIAEKAERSLKALQTDVIDLYQIHRFDPETPIEDTLEALNLLVEQGKIRYYGICNFSTDELKTALNNGINKNFFVSAQMGLNLFKRKHLLTTFPLCTHHNIGVLAYGSLARGVLTDKYLQEELPSQSRARLSDSVRDDVDSFICKKIKLIHQFAVSRSQSILSMSLNWALSQTPVSAVILGVRTIRQLRENISALSTKPSEEDYDQVDNLVGPLAAYDPYCLGVF